MVFAQGSIAPAPASAPASSQGNAQAPLHSSGQVVSGRVTEPASEPVTTAPPPGATPSAGTASTAASAPSGLPGPTATETVAETPAPATITATAVETTSPTQLAQALEIMEPVFSNPVTGVAIFLALLWVLAVLVYRRHQRADAPASNPAHMDEASEAHAHTGPQDSLALPRGLQAEIMALDLELGPSEPLPHTTPAAVMPQSASPSGVDLNLRKLQWAQQLLAAGDNELARVLLTSVAESLQAQLQQRDAPFKGPHP